MAFPSSWIAHSLGLAHPAGPAREFGAIHSDSRALSNGDLFVALPGERVDGHDFLAAALANGAKGLLLARGKTLLPLPPDVLVFEVPDTLAAYRALAGAWRERFRIPVGAVGGAVGKTSTKEFLAALLRGAHGNVLKTEASENGFVGIPRTLLGLRETHGAAAIEIGIDEPGAMEAHARLVKPTAGLLTAIEEEHLEKLRDIETVEREEGRLLEFLHETDGAAVVNLDDPRIASLAKRIGLRNACATSLDGATGASLSGVLDGERLTLRGFGCDGVTLTVPLPGRHQARNLLLAAGLARAMGVPAASLAKGLSSFHPPAGRVELRNLPTGATALLDHYNASPASVRAAIETLQGSPKVLCLGHMRELGPQEEALHRGLADAILASRASAVFLHGPVMPMLADELRSRGYAGTLLHSVDPVELARAIRPLLAPGAAFLLKGSRGTRMERIWEALEPLLGERKT